jgi:sortase B
MKSKAWYDTGISAGEEDRLITLVTCTGNGYSHRFVVQAVVTEEIETASDGVSEALEEKP